jgi:hypothetical protein
MRFLAVLWAISLLTAGAPARGATTGVAYDEVSKTGVGVDPSTFTPAVFDADVQAALDQASKKKLAAASTAQIPQSIAVRLYVTPSKQREDYLFSNTAAIVDCDAKTMTMIDFGAKTYTVQSLDALTDFPAAGMPRDEPSRVEPRTKVPDDAFVTTIDTRALGIKRLEGFDAAGYETTQRDTMKLRGGATTTTNVATRYYSDVSVPELRCADEAPYSDMTRSYLWRWSATQASGYDPTTRDATKSHITTSGPRVPNRLPFLTVFTSTTTTTVNSVPTHFAANATRTMIETGHIRKVSSDDPVFLIPAGFAAAGATPQATIRASSRPPATAGVAYEQVMKSGISGELPPLTVASFDADFQAAAHPDFNVDIIHAYITPSKGRVDNSAGYYAWIVDCEARTITTLNLVKKTYSMKALGTAHAEIAGSFTAMDAALKRNVVARALGMRRLGEAAVPAYETTETDTIDVPGIPASTMVAVIDSYLSDIAMPHLSCAGEARGYWVADDPLAQFPNVGKSGDELPDRIALFRTSRLTRTLPGASGGGGGQAVKEIGHLRTISSDDPIFQPPPDFKPE